MKDSRDVKTRIEELVRGCSTSNEIAWILGTFVDHYEKGYSTEKREDLEKLEIMALKLDIRAAGGVSWHNLLNVLCDRNATAKYINYFESETEKECVLVVDRNCTGFYKIKNEEKTYILGPAA